MADTVVLINEGRLKYNGAIDGLIGDSTLEARFRELTGGWPHEYDSHAIVPYGNASCGAFWAIHWATFSFWFLFSSTVGFYSCRPSFLFEISTIWDRFIRSCPGFWPC